MYSCPFPDDPIFNDDLFSAHIADHCLQLPCFPVLSHVILTFPLPNILPALVYLKRQGPSGILRGLQDRDTSIHENLRILSGNDWDISQPHNNSIFHWLLIVVFAPRFLPKTVGLIKSEGHLVTSPYLQTQSVNGLFCG